MFFYNIDTKVQLSLLTLKRYFFGATTFRQLVISPTNKKSKNGVRKRVGLENWSYLTKVKQWEQGFVIFKMNIKFGQVNKLLFWWLAKCRVDKKLWRHFFRGLLHRCRWLDLLSYFHDLKWTEEKKEKNRGLLKAPKIKAAPASLHQRLDDTSFPRLTSTFFSKNYN